jgi:hypothetical protein
VLKQVNELKEDENFKRKNSLFVQLGFLSLCLKAASTESVEKLSECIQERENISSNFQNFLL